METYTSLASIVFLTFAGCSSGGGSSGTSTQSVAAVATLANPASPGAPGAGAPAPGGPPPGGPVDGPLMAGLARAGIATPAKRTAESDALVALGQSLFFDKVLSGDKNIACSTCHNPAAATDDGLPLALGEGATGAGPARTPSSAAQVIARNAPGLFSAGAARDNVLFWDGRVRLDPVTGGLVTPETLPADLAAQLTTPLAAQALFPVVTSAEMKGYAGENEIANAPDDATAWSLVMARLVGTSNGTVGGIDAYRALFQAAYPAVASFDDFNFGHAARAIAAFEARTYAFFDSPLDRYLAGDTTALSPQAKQGGLLFTGPARCDRCHSGPLLSDLRPHAIAAVQLGPGKQNGDDLGVALVSGDPRDDYRFRTPPLRNVALTGPYTHAGAFGSLRRVLEHYRDPARSLLQYDASGLPGYLQATVDRDPARNQARLAAIDPVIGPGIPLGDADIDALVAFLESLTDPAAQSPPPAPASVPSGLPVGD